MVYSIVALIKHKWTAKGRHGVHSPFVYNFIENILRNTRVIDKNYVIRIPAVSLRFENIVTRIAEYNHYQIVARQMETANCITKQPDLLVLDGAPEDWEVCLNSFKSLPANSAVVATNIHKTKGHSAAWRRLSKNERVRMSIDLYGIGLLLFREEFKVKQHFVLKYR